MTYTGYKGTIQNESPTPMTSSRTFYMIQHKEKNNSRPLTGLLVMIQPWAREYSNSLSCKCIPYCPVNHQAAKP
jgi:hypothetical protein